ncbi:MAG: sodium/solute symporter [Candidatus Hydrogenedens sp.]|jgi:SSS family transporter|nr:sodium/solute symporter [Candidatus Hydrogenedens sp.]
MNAQGTLQVPDYFMIIGYFVLMLIIGLYFYRSMRNVKEYFSGGNSIPWWMSGISFYMSSFSVAAFIFYPSLCYRYGFVGITLLWVAIPATLFGVLFLAVKWRRARIASPVEYLEQRYSPLLRQIFAWQGVPVKVIDDGIKLFAIGTFMSVSLNMDVNQSIIVGGAIMLIYTFMGGLWAVNVTDFIQFIILTAAIIILLPLSFIRAGGWGAVTENMPDSFFKLTTSEYGWGYVIFLVVMYSLSWSSNNWALIQRYYSVPKEKDAIKVGLMVIVLYILGPPLMFLPAMLATQIFPELADAGTVYPMLCKTLLPAGMLGLVVAAMFAATMSTLSGDYNVCASVLTHDIYQRLWRPDASEKELVNVGRIATLLVGIIALATAIFMARGKGEDLFRIMVTLFGLATAPVAIPMILGLLTHKLSARGALIGFLAGLSTGLALFVLSRTLGPVARGPIAWLPESNELLLWGYKAKLEMVLFLASGFITLLVMLVDWWLITMSESEAERIEVFFKRLSIPIGEMPGEEDLDQRVAGVSPFGIVGISLFFTGLLMACVLPWAGLLVTALLNGTIALILIFVGAFLAWPLLRDFIRG